MADLRRLIAWCERERLGPLSDLTRHDLLAYRPSGCKQCRLLSGPPTRRSLCIRSTSIKTRQSAPLDPLEQSRTKDIRPFATSDSS
ncbi:hypothetical protein [Paraburkholderia polaris]|uniref:hypothetical protein n=1 Tax=Paraburkholderia polaris TaxID=2728848 RepID=UPI0038B2C88B